VKNREQWRPLLEEDVDHLVRNETRRSLETDDAPGGFGCPHATRTEKDIGVDIGGQPTSLLCLLFEGLCRTLA
jgi:hypothetical protein